MKEEFNRRLELSDKMLDILIDDESEFKYLKSGRRILVDKGFNVGNLEIGNKGLYVAVSVRGLKSKRSKTSLARHLLGIEDLSIKVDHINRNTLDNRKSNLRAVNSRINALNRSTYKDMPKYIGVHKERSRPRYKVTVHTDKKYFHHFPEKYFLLEEVWEIYDCMVIKLNGDDCLTNNPREQYTPERVDYIYGRYFPLFKQYK